MHSCYTYYISLYALSLFTVFYLSTFFYLHTPLFPYSFQRLPFSRLYFLPFFPHTFSVSCFPVIHILSLYNYILPSRPIPAPPLHRSRSRFPSQVAPLSSPVTAAVPRKKCMSLIEIQLGGSYLYHSFSLTAR